MAEDKVVNILGTEYKVGSADYLDGDDGKFFEYDKEIRVLKKDYLLADGSRENKEQRRDEVIRHEVFHAFFCESGLSEYCADEVLIDWLAMQTPKIYKVLEQLDAIGREW